MYYLPDLREHLKTVHTVMMAVGETTPPKLKVIADTVARGERLSHAPAVTRPMILEMFMNLLPRAWRFQRGLPR